VKIIKEKDQFLMGSILGSKPGDKNEKGKLKNFDEGLGKFRVNKMRKKEAERGKMRGAEGNLGVVGAIFTRFSQIPRGPAVAAFGGRQGLISGTERAQGLEE
jgi:hypothetical protein